MAVTLGGKCRQVKCFKHQRFGYIASLCANRRVMMDIGGEIANEDKDKEFDGPMICY